MRRKLVEGILIGTAAAFAALILWRMGALDRLEWGTWSWREQYFAGPGPATGSIKLVLLDQQSLNWGQKKNHLSWPWPREVYAPIIDFCTRHGATAVVFDVIYSEPSTYGVADDRMLADAISRAPSFVGSLCLHSEATFSTAWPSYLPDRPLLDLANIGPLITGRSEDEFAARSATFPIEEIASSASVLANVIEDPDADGVFRRVNLFRVFDGRIVPSLGFGAFGVHCANRSRESGSKPRSQPCSGRFESERFEVCGRSIPVDHEGKLILRFRGPSGVFKSYSAASVIQSEINVKAGGKDTLDGASFKDAYVFFGFSAPGIADIRSTPLSNRSPGVEIHATLLDNLLAGDFLRDTPLGTVVLSTFLLALLAAVCVASLARRTWHSVLGIALFTPLPPLVGFAAYPLGLWWPVVAQEIAVTAALIGAIVLNYATEGRKRAFIKKAFRHYLSHEVIERILVDPSQLKLGGERKELSIFFSDIEGFSSISEKLDPESLTSFLNLVLSDMTDIILDEGGTLDKYEGDAIIAFWNAPLDQPDHAERACRAALRCQLKIRERQEDYGRMAGRPFLMRIGINTGPVVVGNMGSVRRFDYTVLGDAANLASRLEGTNKFFGTAIIVSGQTWQKTSGKFGGRLLGSIRVLGRTTPVEVFELRGP
ncbi:MAG TPA: adenylate/guanylate cyclase domain-containing protein, partial [Syntrophobacteraceae bacterium]|nr:adenylate/guanylate cyclase domain-containing protein [Syntrophobacteraceae bacterium]